jgi:3,4-dihydroxy 2-butanone 4-phosphate synthase / GTP cyclohydrolase II
VTETRVRQHPSMAIDCPIIASLKGLSGIIKRRKIVEFFSVFPIFPRSLIRPVNMDSFSISDALKAFREGRPVIISDDKDRENEGDLCVPAQFVTPQDVLFFRKYSTGLICVACNPLRIDELKLKPMHHENTDPHRTPFTVSVDLSPKYGITTGVSDFDKAKTINAIADKNYQADDFTKPGHIFPLRANEKGLYGRQGHTELSVELCKLAGVYPACMIAELIFSEGENAGKMMRLNDCVSFAKEHNIPIVRTSDIFSVLPRPEAHLPLEVGGNFVDTQIKVYCHDNCQYIVLIKGEVNRGCDVPLRIHSECLTGDVFRSAKCDCGNQLTSFIDLLAGIECGVLIYVKGHEGRGIGIANKITAYALQEKTGCDTIDANLLMHLPDDTRNYQYVPTILDELGIKTVILHSDNPIKIKSLEARVSAVKSFVGKKHERNGKYIETKIKKFKKRIAIVYTTYWHSSQIKTMKDQCLKYLSNQEIIEIPVEGAYELVMGCVTAKNKGANVIIALAALLKGETDHYQYVADAVSQGLMQFQLMHSVPVVNGVLFCHSVQQIDDRSKECSPLNTVENWCKTALAHLERK